MTTQWEEMLTSHPATASWVMENLVQLKVFERLYAVGSVLNHKAHAGLQASINHRVRQEITIRADSKYTAGTQAEREHTWLLENDWTY